MRYKFAVLCLLLLAGLAAPSASAADAWLIEIDGPIGPASADHMVRGLEQAQAADAALVILRIDTPGGLDTAMREMIKAMLAADVPLIAHVAPGGARAASAGTYILYASHVAAMAPGTNLGAATPVQIASPGIPQMPADDKKTEEDVPQAGSAMEKKLVNDAVAYIQSLAQLRGRNAQWAERAVREGVSLSAVDALAADVIEIIALDSAELLRALDGREVLVGETRQTLHTQDLGIYTHPVDWRSEFLAVITNPNVAYILMLVGIYGLLLEFYNPGVGLPGVTGAICLLLALYAFQALPVSYAGVALILLGIALMTAEAFAPSFGVLGLGGIGAFVFGSIMLMDTEMPVYQVALPMILAVAVFSAGLLVFVMGMLVRARQQVVVSGREQLIGAVATVESVYGGHARVRLEGELWSARCDEPLAANDRVTVDEVDGVTLRVHKTDQ